MISIYKFLIELLKMFYFTVFKGVGFYDTGHRIGFLALWYLVLKMLLEFLRNVNRDVSQVI